MKKTNLSSLFDQSRGIVSEGNAKILDYFKNKFGFQHIQYPTGTVIDGWTIPKEWLLLDAYICFDEVKVCLKNDLLAVPFGSESWEFNGTLIDAMSFINVGEHSGETVYRTNYYSPGNKKVCLKKELLEEHQHCKKVKICVKSRTKDGNLLIGEYYRKGKSDKTVLLTTYCCHPSLGNDNFSGILALEELANLMTSNSFEPFYSYRLAIFPETIGAIFYINSLHKRKLLDSILHTFILTCLGGKAQNYSYKDSPYPNAYSRAIRESIIRDIDHLQVREFTHDGSDERQFSSPGVRLSSSSLSRNRYYEYKEYHTSSDTYDFMDENSVFESINYLKKSIIRVDQTTRIPTSTNIYGEPSLASKKISFHDGGSSVNSSGSFKHIQKDLFFKVYSLCNGGLSTSEIVERLSNEMNFNKSHIVNVVEFLIENKFVEL